MARRCSTCSRRISPKTAALYRGRCAICHLKKPPARFNGPGQLLLPHSQAEGRGHASTRSRPRLCLVVPVAPAACSEEEPLQGRPGRDDPVPLTEEAMQIRDADEVFEAAIRSGVLSRDEESPYGVSMPTCTCQAAS